MRIYNAHWLRRKIEFRCGDDSEAPIQMAAITRNLYREDEVLAALKWCTLKGRAQEAIFWAQEALDSNLQEECLSALFWVWCFCVGITNLAWLSHFRRVQQKGPNAITHDDVQQLLMGLLRGASSRRDGTVFALLGLGITYESKLETLKDAISQCQPLDAWVLSKALWQTMPATAWSLLKDGCGKRVDAREAIHMLELMCSGEWTWPTRAAALTIATCAAATSSPSADWVAPVEWQTYPRLWAHLPMRFRRIHTPPVECLYWLTSRGENPVTETTDKDLTQNLEAALQGSAFWSKICPTQMSDDDYRMYFYDTYFQNDIPDEWSAEDRAKSHGRGPLHSAAADRTIVFGRCLERWFGSIPSQVEPKAAIAALMNDWPRIEQRPIGLLEQINRVYG